MRQPRCTSPYRPSAILAAFSHASAEADLVNALTHAGSAYAVADAQQRPRFGPLHDLLAMLLRLRHGGAARCAVADGTAAGEGPLARPEHDVAPAALLSHFALAPPDLPAGPRCSGIALEHPT